VTETATFVCSICGETSTDICVYCTKDACANHLCKRCRHCSDCCDCEVPLDSDEHEHVFHEHPAAPPPEHAPEAPAAEVVVNDEPAFDHELWLPEPDPPTPPTEKSEWPEE
jgi:hypothetical protein